MIKRILDIAIAAVGLFFLAPVIAVVSCLLYAESGPPVFYRGVRAGLRGRPFRIWKFRTMVANAEFIGGGSTAKDDPRVTRLGGFLRRRKIDELPQLLNVLAGEMSFVGPRPELPQYTDQYTDEERIILSVRPGITDNSSLLFIRLADVLGTQDADTVYEQHVRPVKNALRMHYVRTRSLAGDLKIIFLTVIAVFSLWNTRCSVNPASQSHVSE